ncbi:anion permease [candidate division KSB1 bacterium]|nr:anion permease [candidate division KSB1 bacterium]
MNAEAIFASIIFVCTYIAIGMEKIHRTIVTITAALLLLLSGIVTLPEAIDYISWETIGLLFGLFCVVTALSETGFFTSLAFIMAKKLEYNTVKILVIFPIITGFLSCLMDSITVMLFFATLTIELTRILKADPVPIIVAEVCLANTGGAATLVGDPPNVILGTVLGYTFNDFVLHTGPVALVAGAAAIAYFYIQFRNNMTVEEVIDYKQLARFNPRDAIKDTKLMKLCLVTYGIIILLLIIHPVIENAGIPLTLPLAALIPAFGLLIIAGKRAEMVLSKIDYEVLLFFMGLFVVVGGMEKTGVIPKIAHAIVGIFEGKPYGLISTLLWGSAVSSSVIDNVPFALSMAYVIKDVAANSGLMALSIMVWAVALGTDIGGNATPIGASANVVAYNAMQKNRIRIGWMRWIKIAVPSTLLSIVIANLLIILKYALGFY